MSAEEQIPEETSALAVATAEITGVPEVLIHNDRIKHEDVDWTDGIDTETEAIGAEVGGLMLGGESSPLGVVASDLESPQIAPPENEWAKAYDGLPKIVQDAMSTPNESGYRKHSFDPIKVSKLMPVIESMGVGSEASDAESEKLLISNLALMAHCEDKTASSAEEQELDTKQGEEFIAFAQTLIGKGVSLKGLVELTRTEESMQKVMDLYKQDPSSLDREEAPLSIIVRMSQLPLYDLASSQDKDYYANDQGKQPDVRDSVIATVIEVSEEAQKEPEEGGWFEGELRKLAAYVNDLEAKVPELEAKGFPLDKVGRTLLDRFNLSTRINIYDDAYETKIIDRCIQVGDKIHELESIDSSMAEEVVFGEDDLTEIVDLANDIEKMKADEPEAYALFTNFKKMHLSMRGIKDVKHFLNVSKGIADSPELYDLVKDEEVKQEGGITWLPKNLKMLTDHNSLRPRPDSSQADRFFENCRSISDLMSDKRMDAARLIGVANSLEPDKLEAFKSIMNDPKIQEAYDDPELAPYLNEAISSIGQSLEPDVIIKSLDIFRPIDKKKYFGLGEIIDIADKLLNASNEASMLEPTMFLAAIEKASKRADKDGFPYDSVRSVGEAIKYVVRKSEDYDNPAAVKKEILEWYEPSGLPYAALPTVVKMAEEAEKQGVAFEPMAVYKWIYADPARIKQVSRENLQDYIVKPGSGLRSNSEQSADEIIATAEQEVLERKDSFRLLVNIKQEALMASAEDSGNIDSLFDDVEMTQRGTHYELYRSGVEIALGIRSLDESEEHRVYGSCAFIDKGVPEGARGYGDIVLTFSPNSEAVAGTTFTPEDSFHGTNRLTIEDAQLTRHLKDKSGIGHLGTSEYVESQIPGAVTLYDAEQIVAVSEEQAEQLRTQLPPELSAKVVVR